MLALLDSDGTVLHLSKDEDARDAGEQFVEISKNMSGCKLVHVESLDQLYTAMYDGS